MILFGNGFLNVQNDDSTHGSDSVKNGFQKACREWILKRHRKKNITIHSSDTYGLKGTKNICIHSSDTLGMGFKKIGKILVPTAVMLLGMGSKRYRKHHSELLQNKKFTKH